MKRIKLFENFNPDELDIRFFTWSSKRNSFSCEISDMDGKIEPAQKLIKIKNYKTGNVVEFEFVKADKDGSDEDTYGWRYESKNKTLGLKLLVIND